MTEKEIEITTPDGIAGGFLYAPASTVPLPGVVHLTDIGGIRASHEGMAKRVAALGYVVLMPNVFYRTRKPPVFDFPAKFGDERTTKRMEEVRAPLTPQAMESDAGAYIDFLARQAPVNGGAMGVVGYCLTGAMALRTAAARPDKIAVAASFHGGGLFTAALYKSAHGAATSEGPLLFRARRRGSRHAGGSDPEFRGCPGCLGWKIRKRNLRRRISWLDGARQSRLQPNSIGASLREADAVTRRDAVAGSTDEARHEEDRRSTDRYRPAHDGGDRGDRPGHLRAGRRLKPYESSREGCDDHRGQADQRRLLCAVDAWAKDHGRTGSVWRSLVYRRQLGHQDHIGGHA